MSMDKTDENKIIKNLIFEDIRERKKTRYWNIFFKFSFIILLLIILIIIIERKNKNLKEHVAIIEINGIISEKNKTNSKNIINVLNRAFYNKNCRSIIIKINSPGGTPVQANIIHNHIKSLKKINTEKQIYSVIEDIGTSGAYLIATATDKIYCDQSSIVGSIGVLLNSFGFVEILNKLGIERRLYKSSKYKAILDPFSEKSAEEDMIIQKNLNIIHKNFVNVVKNNRPNLLNNESEIFSGKFWIGKEALEIGLVDGFYDIYTLSLDVIKLNSIIYYDLENNILNLLKIDKFLN